MLRVCLDKVPSWRIWSCLGWKGLLMKSGQGSGKERADGAEGVRSDLQGVVCLLGMAVVCCLGRDLLGEEPS